MASRKLTSSEKRRARIASNGNVNTFYSDTAELLYLSAFTSSDYSTDSGSTDCGGSSYDSGSSSSYDSGSSYSDSGSSSSDCGSGGGDF